MVGGHAGQHRPAHQRRAGLTVHRGTRRLPGPAAACAEAPPGLERLARPDPNAGGDPHHKAHEVLEHEDSIVRLGAVRVPRAGAVLCLLPGLPVVLLVDVAGNDNGGRHSVKHGEDADADHQLLQLVSFGAALLDHAADAKERDEASQQEEAAGEEINH